MCTFEILSPKVDIVNYLVPRWHVSSTSCNLLILGVKMILDFLLSTTGNHFQILLVFWQLVLTYVWYKLLIIFTLAFAFICLISCLGLCQLPLFSIPLVKCFLDIVKVVIPPCAFCIQMQILYNVLVLGELSYFL